MNKAETLKGVQLVVAVGVLQQLSEYRTSEAIHYIDALVSNIKGRFSEGAINLLHHPSLIQLHFQLKNRLFPSMARKKYKRWSTSTENKQTIEFQGETYTSPPLVDSEEILAEWRVFARAMVTEKKAIMEKRKFHGEKEVNQASRRKGS